MLFRSVFAVISSEYGISLLDDDFKYTRNRSKYGSYHVSIPRVYGSLAELKNICTVLLDKYPDKYTKDGNNLLDPVVYSSRWFRAPNQLKEGVAGTEHEIISGVIRDFIIEYIPDDAIELERLSASGVDFNAVTTIAIPKAEDKKKPAKVAKLKIEIRE